MKSPWKLVAQLVSRRHPAVAPDELDRDESKDVAARAIENATDRTSVSGPEPSPIGDDVESSEVRPPDDALPTLPEVQESEVAAVELDSSTSEQDLTENVVEGSDRSPAVPVEATQEGEISAPVSMARRKTDGTARKSPVSRASRRIERVDETRVEQATPPEKTFADEAAGLDQEISQLRSQLTEKLRLQNAQLKSMLKRFEGR